ncbi:deoxyribose-phosphate aldolase [Clostridium argentinense CDC 2741]|uniref:Deoxyribose-phosphate aldolase n=1 Tax=Clostridium argentinense CDC 2741 TaxID=1418104 RepID=A0A0C1U4J8_9CLOT|nr:deoxyribose-phosphate aldolase [Clostridium argentinense]ARC85016.1 2-deoxyribose-5-phosphate aldolase [Clostridium argentinense]KIE46493.1 deoxyribose-phosphate aldolase [Clostridium argentinense CDC 2741]NFF40455.1 deoxyribose-phosphate aldolase [Clostridium argentinense]NFP50530.1 deoxyribose-phosphate aldolase [Clostridium argentinense]NFP72864.1 deoxyribose-phosphate aldolase [Clostridium argentinense]
MNIASMIDHTILKADTTIEQVKKICDEAKEYKFKSVCVNSCYTKFVSDELRGSGVLVCTVVGFPLGTMDSKAKAFETARAIELGANEIDMVINIGALRDKNYDLVLKDIKEVVETAKDKAIVKVIIEACLLTEEEKIKACELSVEAGADFVKTSTGFSTGGATVEDIKLMRKVVGPQIGVKASGGVRTTEDALKFIEAGANRIGASASIAIVNNDSKITSDY